MGITLVSNSIIIMFDRAFPGLYACRIEWGILDMVVCSDTPGLARRGIC